MGRLAMVVAVAAAGAVGAATWGVPAAPAAVMADPAPTPALFDESVVHDVAITVGAADWQTLLGCRGAGGGRPGMPVPTPRSDVSAVLEVDGVRFENVGVRCKGNSSLNISGSKKPLNLTLDAFVPGQDLWGFDVVNFNNGWADPSQIREAVSLRLLGEYLPSPRFGFARVTMEGRYLGLYTMVEQVEGTFAQHWFPDDGGMIVKGDSPTRIAFNSSTLQWLGADLAPYRRGYEVKGADAVGDAGYEAVRELTRALDAPASAGGLDTAAFPAGIRRVLDVESALWYLATSNIIDNFDSYYVGKNYFLYLGRRDPRFHVVPWDLGLAFGIFGLQNQTGGRPGPGQQNDPARVSPFAQETDANRPLVRRLLAVPSFRADYVAHYRALYEEVYTTEWVEETGGRYQEVVREAARQEATANGRIAGSYSFDQFLRNLREPVTSAGGMPGPSGGGAPGLVSLVRDRRAYLATVAALAAPDVELAARSHVPASPRSTDEVVVRAVIDAGDAVADVELRYRVDGGLEIAVPMAAGAAGEWLGTIPAQRQGSTVTYVVRVGLADGRAHFFPTATLTKPFRYAVEGVYLPEQAGSALVINELQPDNEATLADEAGEFDDWVELYNRGSQAVDLSDHYLSDDPDDPWAFELPERVLQPGERVLVWCDNDPEQGPLHAPFRLEKNGEMVHLSTRTARVDAVEFGPLLPDESAMRLPDGADGWLVCRRATPNQANACPSESMATPGGPTPGVPPPTTAAPPTATGPTPTRDATATRRATATATSGPTGRVTVTATAPVSATPTQIVGPTANGGGRLLLPLATRGRIR